MNRQDGRYWDLGGQLSTKSQRVYGLIDPNELKRRQEQQQLYQSNSTSMGNIGKQFSIPTTSGLSKSSVTNQVLSMMYPVSSGVEHRHLSESEEAAAGSNNQGLYGQQPLVSNASVQELIRRRQDLIHQSMASPNNYLVQLALEDCEAQIKQWAAANKQPGVFYGSTDAPICNRLFDMGTKSEVPEGMSRRQYNKTQPWLTKSSLNSGSKISSGVGKNLLVRMGWREGFGLGKVADGLSEPVVPGNFRGADRRGLSTCDEKPTTMAPVTVNGSTAKRPPSSTSGKHPVSMLMELCAKNHFPAPEFSDVLAQGPSHCPHFIMKVRVNGVDYQPAHSSSTKKDAKVACALLCLTALGIYSDASCEQKAVSQTIASTTQPQQNIALSSPSSASNAKT